MSQFYDRAGRPIEDIMEWARLIEQREYAEVAVDHVGDVVVSTVWLGIDHNWLGHGPPIIFETMIFGGAFDRWQWRYCTDDQALVGHANAVRLAQGDAELEESLRSSRWTGLDGPS